MEQVDRIAQVWPGWRTEELIGQGGFGSVYRASRTVSGHTSTAAVKIIDVPSDVTEVKELRSMGMDDASIRDYFGQVAHSLMNEIAAMDSLRGSANIVHIEDYQLYKQEDGPGWTVLIRMELLESLEAYQERMGMPDQREAARIGSQVCDALARCHAIGIIHRDVKPANVFRNEFGDYKLGDFGIAKNLGNATRSTMSFAGTRPFMAPEVESGHYDESVDTYSLGIMLYRWLNGGRPPFVGPDEVPTQAVLARAQARRLAGERPPLPAGRGVDPKLTAIVRSACEPEPTNRWASAAEFGQALRGWLGSHPVSANSATTDPIAAETTSTDQSVSSDAPSPDYSAGTVNFGSWMGGKWDGPQHESEPQERPAATAEPHKHETTNGAKPYQFDRGFLHPAFANYGENGAVELTNPSILLTDAVLSTPDDVMATMTAFWKAAGPVQPPFLVIARGANEETLDKLASFNSRGFPVWVVKAPGYGDRCREMLIDIATVTGGSIFPAISSRENSRLASGRIAAGELGRAELVRVSADSTSIYGGAGSEIAVLQRMEMISREIDATASDYDREKLVERFDALMGQVTGRSSSADTARHGARTSAAPAEEATGDGSIYGTVEIDAEEAAAGTKYRYEYAIPSTGETVCLDIGIPAGVTRGQTLRLRRCGDYVKKDGERGDLYLSVNIKPSNTETAGREARAAQTSSTSATQATGSQPHTAVNANELRSFVAKVAGRAGKAAPWVPELGCYQVQSTARILAHKMRTYFLIMHDDNATVGDFDAFSRACARWVRSNKEFNNNMVAYPVLLQARARHDVVAYAKQAPPGFLRDPGILTLPTVVDLSTGDVQFMDASPTVGLLMWKGIRKAAVEALG